MEQPPSSYLVFLDDFFSRPWDRNAVLDGLGKDLAILPPGDRVGIARFDGERLEVLLDWTADRAAIAQALAAARSRPAFGLQRLVEWGGEGFAVGAEELRQSIALLADQASGSPVDGAEPVDPRVAVVSQDPEDRSFSRRGAGEALEELSDRPEVVRLAGQMQGEAWAVAAALLRFGQPPGRRAVLVLSGGWPYLPAGLTRTDRFPRYLPLDLPGAQEIFRPLIDASAALAYQVTFVDVPGLTGGGWQMRSIDVEAGLGREGSFGTYLDEKEVETNLRYLAQATGGEAALNSRGLGALALASRDVAATYVLGITARPGLPEGPLDLEVEVLRPGARVRVRPHLVDLDREHRSQIWAQAGRLLETVPDANRLTVETGKPELQEKDRMRVPIDVTLPLGELVFLPVEGDGVARPHLRIEAVDARGRRAVAAELPVEVGGGGNADPGAVRTVHTVLELRRAHHELVFTLDDPLSGRTWTGRAEVDPSGSGPSRDPAPAPPRDRR